MGQACWTGISAGFRMERFSKIFDITGFGQRNDAEQGTPVIEFIAVSGIAPFACDGGIVFMHMAVFPPFSKERMHQESGGEDAYPY